MRSMLQKCRVRVSSRRKLGARRGFLRSVYPDTGESKTGFDLERAARSADAGGMV